MAILNLLIAGLLAALGLFETGGEGGSDEDPPEKAKKPDRGGGGGETDWEAEATKWKALARKHETQAKENAGAATKLKELEDADKSEIDKLKEAAATEKRRADEAEARALRLEIAGEKGLTAAQAKRLVGSTREELEADADELLEAFGSKSAADEGKNGKSDKSDKPDARRRPTESLRSGSRTDSYGDDEVDAKKAEEIAEATIKSGGI